MLAVAHRLILVGAVIAAGTIGLLAAQAQTKQKLTIGLNWSPTGEFGALFLAKNKGWFGEAGLDVDLQDGKGSPPALQLVVAGHNDVTEAHLGAMAAGISNGMPLISIACSICASDYGLLVPADSGWRRLQELKGKRIVVAATGGVSVFFEPYVKASGMQISDFQVIKVDSNAIISTYVTGQADAAFSALAFILPLVEKVRKSIGFDMAESGLTVPGYGLVVRKDMVETKADTLRKLIAVNQRAWKYIGDGHVDEAVDAILSERAGLRLDRELTKGQLVEYLRYTATPATKGKPIGWQAESDWVNGLESMRRVGMVNGTLKPEDVYTNKLLPAQ